MCKKILFFCIPAHGHTNPTLGVVRELISRGDEVWYYSYELFREKIEATGAHFVACDAYDAEQKLNPKDGARAAKDLRFSTKLLVDTTLALDEKIAQDIQQINPDCIVADSMAVWGKAAALKYSIPFVSSTTTFAFNRYSAQTMKQSPRQMLSMLLGMPGIQKQMRRLQQRGYPFKSILDIIANDGRTDTIVYTSPQFQPCADSFSDRYAFVGPILRPAVHSVQKQKEKLIYISMGTVNNDLLPFYRNCMEAICDMDVQAILSVGDLVDKDRLLPLPEQVEVKRHVDQMAVLEQADVFLTHCGMNSVSEALYHGVPLVMNPKTAEQGAVASRVQQLGAGVKLKKETPAAISAALKKTLYDPSYRNGAQRIAEGFRQCSGAKGAADHIHQVCK